MKAHPIIFSGEMIKAILVGRKTQTRRVIKPQPWRTEHGDWAYIKSERSIYAADQWMSEGGMRSQLHHHCPYGAADDRLWVREGYQIKSAGVREYHRFTYGRYLADDAVLGAELTEKEYEKWAHRKWPFRTTPGRFMYRSLSRITLDIMSVRVERVQDIILEDMIAEGVIPDAEAHFLFDSYAVEFCKLWDSINAKRGYGWDVNPWCWCIEFSNLDRRCK